MATYIAFLRAINLGATRKFPKAAVVAAVEAAGGTGVQTYLNTGNVRFDSDLDPRSAVEEALEQAFAGSCGFEVPTVVVTPAELTAIAEQAAELRHTGKHYVSLLKAEPTASAVRRLEAAGKDSETARVCGRAVHLLLGDNYHQARLTNAVVERHLGVATNRNVTVLRKLAAQWGTDPVTPSAKR